MNEETKRKKQIVRVSIVGILANIALAAFKAAVGLLSNSIAITLDAVNNLSDAASSAITIVGTKMAGKAADREHPYGYGRIEYLTAMIVSTIVLWAGITSLVESVKSIMNHQTPSYDAISLVIIGVAVIVKLVLGRYVTSAGKRLQADALVASGADASFDAIISASTLVAALVFVFTGISVEAWLGAVISVVIIKSGIEMFREGLDKVLGARVDAELSHEIKKTANDVEGVRGAYDLILSDYGPQRLWGSIHVEVSETISARDVDRITRQIQERVYDEHKVILHTVGIYSTNEADDSEIHGIRTALEQILDEESHALQMHGLYVDVDSKYATFDIVVAYESGDRMAVRQRVIDALKERFPDYTFNVVLDSDVAD